MTRYALHISKRTDFQGRSEVFGNTYHYEISEINPDFDALVNAVVTLEKQVHAAAVTFLRASVWDVGTPPNFMRFTKDLSGNGTKATQTNMYRECAILVQWPLARRLGIRRSVHRSLKKWVRTHWTAVVADLGGNVPLDAATKTALLTYATSVQTPAYGGSANLCSPTGDFPNGPPFVSPYLEHRQFQG